MFQVHWAAALARPSPAEAAKDRTWGERNKIQPRLLAISYLLDRSSLGARINFYWYISHVEFVERIPFAMFARFSPLWVGEGWYVWTVLFHPPYRNFRFVQQATEPSSCFDWPGLWITDVIFERFKAGWCYTGRFATTIFSTTQLLDCKTVGFFLKISKEIGNAWRKSLMRANRASLTRP